MCVGVICIVFALCFGVGFTWGYFTSSTDKENVIADNTKIVNNSLLFEFAGLKAIYDLDKEQINIENVEANDELPKLNRKEVMISTFTFSGMVSLTERNITSLKYLKFLKNGSKPSKVALLCIGAGVCLGSVCGFSQGSYFGRTLRQQETALLLYPKLKDRSSWLSVINKNPLLKLKYKTNTKGCIAIVSPANVECVAYKNGLTSSCVLLRYNEWNITNNTYSTLSHEIEKSKNKPKMVLLLNMQEMKTFEIELPPGVVGMKIQPSQGNDYKVYKIAIDKYKEWIYAYSGQLRKE